jgi:hypothetical protein
LQALNRVHDIMKRGDLNPDYIMMDGDATLEPFTDRFENKLAGWAMTFDVIMPSDMTICDTGFTSGCPNVTVTDGASSVQVLAGGTYTCSGGAVVVSNSNDSYLVTTSTNLELPNTTVNVYVNGSLNSTGTIVTLDPNQVINISA